MDGEQVLNEWLVESVGGHWVVSEWPVSIQ